MKKYPCNLSPEKFCEYGGCKTYNYGFILGNAEYCRLNKMWVCDIKTCPKEEKNANTRTV